MKIAVWGEGSWCRLEILEEFAEEQGLPLEEYATFTVLNEAEADRIAQRLATGGDHVRR